jgi:transposase
MVQSEDCSVTKAANELSISGSSLRPWINEYDEYGESAFPGYGNALSNSTYEIKKLQKANEELRILGTVIDLNDTVKVLIESFCF